jgi:hypothetical protein
MNDLDEIYLIILLNDHNRDDFIFVENKVISPSVYGNMAPNRITGRSFVNLSIAPCSENRQNHDALTSLISLVLYGFKSPNWQSDAV